MIRVVFDNTHQDIPIEKKYKWIDLLSPTHTEMKQLIKEYKLNVEFLTAALDPNERARHEVEDDKMLIVIRFPIETDNDEEDQEELPYRTYPMAIIIAPNLIITVSLIENPIIESLIATIERISRLDPTDFDLYVFLRTNFPFLS